MDEQQRDERDQAMRASTPVDIAAGTEADDPWVGEQLARARRDLDKLDQSLIRGTLARREVLRLTELTPIEAPFLTNHREISSGDCWAVDGKGRLHKEVGGRWYPQSNLSEATYVVRTS